MPEASIQDFSGLSARQDASERAIEQLTRTVVAQGDEMRSGFARLGEKMEESRRFPIAPIVSAIIGVGGIAVALGTFMLSSYSEDTRDAREDRQAMRSEMLETRKELSADLDRQDALLRAHIGKPGHDVAMEKHGLLDRTMQEYKVRFGSVDDRLRQIETTRTTDEDGARILDRIGQILERTVSLEARLDRVETEQAQRTSRVYSGGGLDQ